MDYANYQHLTFDPKPNGVVLITINRPEVLNAANARLHWELGQVWLTVDADPRARVALITGAGRAFSAGGDLTLVDEMAGNPEIAARRECFAGPRHQRHARRRIGVDCPPDLGQLPVESRVGRVQDLRPVDGDQHHPARSAIERQVLVLGIVHSVPPGK